MNTSPDTVTVSTIDTPEPPKPRRHGALAWLRDEALKKLAAAYDEAEGEVTVEIEHLEAEIEALGEEHLESLAYALKENEAEIKAIAEEKRRLDEYRVRAIAEGEALARQIRKVLGSRKGAAFPTIKISTRRTPVLVVKDGAPEPEALPVDFCRTKTTYSAAKREILAELKKAAKGESKLDADDLRVLKKYGEIGTSVSVSVK